MPQRNAFDIAEYIAAVEDEFSRHANKTRAAASKAYVRDLFDYYGMTTPQRRDVQKVFHEETALPPFETVPEIVKILWTKPQRELQYFAWSCTKNTGNNSRKRMCLFLNI